MMLLSFVNVTEAISIVFSMAIIIQTETENMVDMTRMNRFTKFECYDIPCIVQTRDNCLYSVNP